jgi:hypothetical protein
LDLTCAGTGYFAIRTFRLPDFTSPDLYRTGMCNPPPKLKFMILMAIACPSACIVSVVSFSFIAMRGTVGQSIFIERKDNRCADHLDAHVVSSHVNGKRLTLSVTSRRQLNGPAVFKWGVESKQDLFVRHDAGIPDCHHRFAKLDSKAKGWTITLPTTEIGIKRNETHLKRRMKSEDDR